MGCPPPSELESERRWVGRWQRGSGTRTAATFQVSLHLFHEGGAISALEDIFPPLAANRLAALTSAAPAAFHDGHLGGCGTGGIIFLAADGFSDYLPHTWILLLAVIATEARLAQAIGLPLI